MKSTIAVCVAGVLALWAALSLAQNRPPTAKGPADGTLTNSIGIKLVRIPAGQFLMGSGRQ